MNIHHTGYAVKDLDSAVEKFLILGYRTCGEAVDDVGRGVKIRFMEDGKCNKVELVAPLSQKSPVDGWIEKNGNSPYHICYESDDIERDSARLRTNGFIILQNPLPAPAINGRKVTFLYSRETGMLELVEREAVS